MDWKTACEILGVSPDVSEQQVKEQRNYWLNVLHPDKTAGLPPRIKEKADKDFIDKKAAWEYLLVPGNRPMHRSAGRVPEPPRERPAARPQNESSASAKAKPILIITPKHIRFKDVANLETKATYFEINNIGGPFTHFSILRDHIPRWLEITEIKRLSRQELPVQVQIRATGQQVGFKYECQIPIIIENRDCRFTDERRVHIELVMKESVIQVDKKTVQFDITPGVIPPPQTIILTSSGSGLIEGDIVPRQHWIKIGARHVQFQNTYKIQVQVDTSKLSTENIGFIDINTNGGYDNIMVKVVPISQPIKTKQKKPG